MITTLSITSKIFKCVLDAILQYSCDTDTSEPTPTIYTHDKNINTDNYNTCDTTESNTCNNVTSTNIGISTTTDTNIGIYMNSGIIITTSKAT